MLTENCTASLIKFCGSSFQTAMSNEIYLRCESCADVFEVDLGVIAATEQVFPVCTSCHSIACYRCQKNCYECDEIAGCASCKKYNGHGSISCKDCCCYTCDDHYFQCDVCGENMCESCVQSCEKCAKQLCDEHAISVEDGEVNVSFCASCHRDQESSEEEDEGDNEE